MVEVFNGHLRVVLEVLEIQILKEVLEVAVVKEVELLDMGREILPL